MPAEVAEPVDIFDDQPDLVRRKLLFQAPPPVALAPAEVEDEDESPERTIADYIRSRCRQKEIVAYLSFLAPPFSVPEASLQDVFARLMCQTEYQDIAVINGNQDRYYYSTSTMSTNYANTLALLLEQDSCRTIAETVRFESRVYPRPYKLAMLMDEPYYFSVEQIEAAQTLMSQDHIYQDIQRVVASNDEIYLFSLKFMSYGKAKGLCEWLEVEQYENP
jgi:hypothetical protein